MGGGDIAEQEKNNLEKKLFINLRHFLSSSSESNGALLSVLRIATPQAISVVCRKRKKERKKRKFLRRNRSPVLMSANQIINAEIG